MARIIVVRPFSRWDWVLDQYSAPWGKKVVDDIESCGTGTHIYRDLGGEHANREEVEAALRQFDGCDAFFFFGHSPFADPEFADGQHLAAYHATETSNEPPVIDRHNCHLLKGAIVYAWACCSTLSIGREAISRGATTYIGYSTPLHVEPTAAEEWLGRAAISVPRYLLGTAAPNAGERSTAAAVAYGIDTCEAGISDFRFGKGSSSGVLFFYEIL